MKAFLRIVGVVLAVVIVLALIVPLGFRFFGWYWGWAFGSHQSATSADPVVNAQSVSTDCYVRAAKLGAPDDAVKAICDAVPGTDGVSQRLTSGTKVSIGSITFDSEYRVWFLEGFTVPATASYAFEYKGAERQLFEAPFVLGTELGYGKNGERVPFSICWDTTSDGCVPPTNLFPTK